MVIDLKSDKFIRLNMLGSYVDRKIATQKTKLNYCKQTIKIL